MYSQTKDVSHQRYYLQHVQGFFKAEVYIKSVDGQKFVFKDYSRYRFNPIAASIAYYLVAREKRALNLLQHSGIAPQCFPSPHPLVLKQEFIPGQALDKSSRLDAEVVNKVLQLLKRLHRQGITHNDVRASNIILKPNGQPLLIDFASAHKFIFPRWRLCRWFKLMDVRHAIKLKGLTGQSYSPREMRLLRQPLLIRALKHGWKKGILRLLKML